MPEYITIAEFAERAGVTRQSAYRRLDKELQQFVREVDGRKTIDVAALDEYTPQNNSRSSCSATVTVTEEVTDNCSATVSATERLTPCQEKEDKLVQVLEERIAALSVELKEERADKRRLTDQLITLSSDFSDLARQSNTLLSQSQSLQGHIQQRTLGTVDSVDATTQGVDATVDPQKRKGLFSRMFR